MPEICPHEENVCYVFIRIGFLFCFHSNFVKDLMTKIKSSSNRLKSFYSLKSNHTYIDIKLSIRYFLNVIRGNTLV